MHPEYFTVRCLKCGQKNRIRQHIIEGRSTCGRCGAYLDELIVSCLVCQTKNRIPEDKLHNLPLCGKCGAPLYHGYVLEISDKTFDNEINSFPGPVFICCWAPWCVSCRIVLPLLDEIAPRYAGGVKIAKVNVDENLRTVSQYSISNTPTFLLFSNRRLIKKLTGALTKKEIDEHLKSLVKSSVMPTCRHYNGK